MGSLTIIFGPMFSGKTTRLLQELTRFVDVTTESHSATLTNKTIDADSNTITNIENADIKALAAIDATKIADGTVTNTEFQ
jgi:thymidine kinase